MMVTRISLIFGMSYMTFTIVGKFKPKAVSPPGGNSAYERGGDTRHLAYGCKFRILVSLRVFWAKRHHI